VVSRTRDDEGAGTVLAVAMMGLLVTVTIAVAGVVGVIATHRTAQAAADLAALAGAAALQDGGDACARAADVADRNRASLSGCEVDGWDVAVVVVAHSAPLPGGVLDLPARGRAGPAASGGP
jgi:secretion/DNA translocation related TadE-like protein